MSKIEQDLDKTFLDETKTLYEEVKIIVEMLESKEWAEHVGKTPLGKRLEWAITTLINEVSEKDGQPECVESLDEGFEEWYSKEKIDALRSTKVGSSDYNNICVHFVKNKEAWRNVWKSSREKSPEKIQANMYWINPDYPSAVSIIEAFDPVDANVGDRYEVGRAKTLPSITVEVTELSEYGHVENFKVINM